MYVGFGSMAARDARHTTNLILEAIRKAKARAVLATGRGGLSDLELQRIPENIHILEECALTIGCFLNAAQLSIMVVRELLPLG